MLSIRHRGRRLAASVLYDGAFKMLVDTTKAGSASDTFVLPCTSGGYNALVSWGDGSSQLISGAPGNVTHVYPAAGLYVVSIKERVTGGFPRLYFFNGGDKLKVLDVLQWGENEWSTLESAFFGCANMVISAKDAWRAKTHKATSLATTFRGCTSLVRLDPFDIRAVTTMSGTFLGCTLLKEAPRFNLVAVTNLTQAWYACPALTEFPWLDTKNVTNFTSAWFQCTGLNGYDFPTLDMRSITNGTTMMYQTAISKASYNSMLDQLANGRGAIPAAAATAVTFRVDAHYDASTGGYDGTAARAYLTGTKTWTITDAGTP